MTDAGAVGSGRRIGLISITSLVVVWIGFLFTETVLTANPIIVSRPQVLLAPVVVVGLPDGNRGSVKISTVFRGNVTAGQELKVLDLDQSDPSQTNGEYVFPLTPIRTGGYRIAAIPVDEMTDSLSDRRPIYPGTE